MKVKDFIVDIQPISSTDVTEIKRLEQECNLSPWSIKDYYAEVCRMDSIAFAAKIEEKIVGFIIARLINNNHANSFNEIEIYNLCVARKYRRNKIGKALIYQLFKTTGHKINSIWLEVRESNEKAISFYSNLGFKIMAKRKNFYRNPSEDGLLMKKSF